MNTRKTQEELIQYINELLDGKAIYIDNELQMHLKQGWTRQIEKIYQIEPQHKIHRFKPRERYGTYEEIVQYTFRNMETDAINVHGVWYYIFKLLYKL